MQHQFQYSLHICIGKPIEKVDLDRVVPLHLFYLATRLSLGLFPREL